jgi:hypothetical protein
VREGGADDVAEADAGLGDAAAAGDVEVEDVLEGGGVELAAAEAWVARNGYDVMDAALVDVDRAPAARRSRTWVAMVSTRVWWSLMAGFSFAVEAGERDVVEGDDLGGSGGVEGLPELDLEAQHVALVEEEALAGARGGGGVLCRGQRPSRMYCWRASSWRSWR